MAAAGRKVDEIDADPVRHALVRPHDVLCHRHLVSSKLVSSKLKYAGSELSN